MSLRPTIRAGVPAINKAVYHRIRFLCHDPAVIIELPEGDSLRSTLIIRDVEVERAKVHARADRVITPRQIAPPGGLDGDREIATAEAAAIFLRRAGVTKIYGDRSLPLLYVERAREVGVEIVLDAHLGVRERRQKDETEVAYLRQAQRDTESAVEMACRVIARATPRADGVLLRDGQPLTSDLVRTLIDLHLMKRGYVNADCIVAGGPIGADCHHPGEGELRTGEPVLIDVFPMSKATLYHGDCTRTVVHGQIPPHVQQMHDWVARAKAEAEGATKAGVTGADVHRATTQTLEGYDVYFGFLAPGTPADTVFLPHGTGHGIGLDLKEPPLLDVGGVMLLAGDAVTIEPALYRPDTGGVRIEDLYIVREDGAENMGTLPETLDWR